MLHEFFAFARDFAGAGELELFASQRIAGAQRLLRRLWRRFYR